MDQTPIRGIKGSQMIRKEKSSALGEGGQRLGDTKKSKKES